MKVYIVWDQSRREHGEIAELLDVFLSAADAEHFIKTDVLNGVDEEDMSIEERGVLGSLTSEQVDEIAQHVLARARSGMRVAIGDSTPKQYDRADQMAGYIISAVKYALVKLGYAKEEV
jgi:hypothetical protein